ncbi:MAG: amidohydrolase family protein [Planctomycetota bacterium]
MRSIIRFALVAALLLGGALGTGFAPAAATPGVEGGDAFVVVARRIYVLDRVDYIDHGWMLVVDGRIAAIGDGTPPADHEIVDLGDACVMPGLVAMKSDLFEGSDTQGIGALYVSADKFNPYADFARAWRYGITAARLHPPADRFVAGVGSVVRFGDETSATVLTRENDLVLNFNDGAGRGESAYAEIKTPTSLDVPFVPAERRRPETRLGRIGALEAMIADAEAQKAGDFDSRQFSRRLDAFGAMWASGRPVFADARRESDIRQAIEAMRRTGRRGWLYGLDEALLVADEIAAAKLPVVFETNNDLLAMDEAFDPVNPLRHDPRAAAALERRGLEVILSGETDDLLLAAALAVKGGMSESSALRAVTSRPADLLGIGGRVGRLTVGRDADFIVLNGEPLATASHVQETWVAGRAVWKQSVNAAGNEKAPRREALVVRAGRVYDGLGNVFRDGEVLIENGKIVACGTSVGRPRYARIHDAGPDAVVTPGFIDAHGHLGLEGDQASANADFDLAEIFRVARGPFGEVARSGVTTVVVSPRRASNAGSPMVAIKTADPKGEGLVTKAMAGLEIAVAGNTETAEKNLEGLLTRAEAYHKAWLDYEAALEAFEKQKKAQGNAPAPAPAPTPAPAPAPKPAPAPAGGDDASDILSGTWQVTLSGGPIPDKVTVPMRLALDGAEVTGTIADPLGGGEDAVIRGTLSGKTLQAEIEIEDSPFGNPKLTATIDGPDHMKGGINIGGMIDIDLDGKRTERGRPKITVKNRGRAAAVPVTAEGPKKPKRDPRMEPFRQILTGRAGVILTAQGLPAQRAAAAVFAKRKIPVVLGSAAGVDEVLSDIDGALVAVSLATRELTRNENRAEIAVPAELDRAGITAVFRSDAEWAASRLPLMARAAVREGFSPESALYALTGGAARFLRLEKEVGSFSPGCDGDLLVFDGEPFDVRTNLVKVIIRGQEVR